MDHIFGAIRAYGNTWDSREANVVCKQLGYPSIGNEIFYFWCYTVHHKNYLYLIAGAIAVTNAYYFQDSRKFAWLNQVHCDGTEDHLQDCDYTRYTYYCGGYCGGQAWEVHCLSEGWITEASQ